MLLDINSLDIGDIHAANRAMDYICINMRKKDAEEIFALRPHDSPLRLAMEAMYLIRNQGRGRIAFHDRKPVAVAAFTQTWPGTWEAWMFGTDDFRAVALELIRWTRSEVKDILTVAQGRRLQCDSRADYTEAHQLLRALGAQPEGPPMLAYGKDGAAYQRFVWLNGVHDAVLEPHYVRADR